VIRSPAFIRGPPRNVVPSSSERHSRAATERPYLDARNHGRRENGSAPDRRACALRSRRGPITSGEHTDPVACVAGVVHTGRMGRTVSAVVTWGDSYLGVIGPFPVSIPWWSEVERVVARLREELDVPVFVLRLLRVDGGQGGRDGHVTYHVAALSCPASGLLPGWPADQAALAGPGELRVPWARLEGIHEVLSWASDTLRAAGRRVTGPAVQRKTWNLSALFQLPTGKGPVWLKTTPRFAADEGSVIAAFARADPSLVPPVIGAGQRRVEQLPGEDCWDASPQIITSAVQRLAAAQAALAVQPPARIARPAHTGHRRADSRPARRPGRQRANHRGGGCGTPAAEPVPAAG
jgi:hypothetical protein